MLKLNNLNESLEKIYSINESTETLTEATAFDVIKMRQKLANYLNELLVNGFEGGDINVQSVDGMFGYDSDWCSDDGSSPASQKVERARESYIIALLDSMFENYPYEEE